jgi:glyoxylase-like metal-dependent hydrolase (beta-lactamase superfamily II)
MRKSTKEMLEFQLITEHIARLELPFKFAEMIKSSVSVWLVRSREGFALIDAGPPEAAGEMVDAISSATDGRGPSVVLLTHGHYNHAGGLSALRLAWNPPIAAHSDEVSFIRGDREYARVRSKNPWYWIGSLLMNKTPWSIPNVQLVEAGQTFFGLKLIHLPGHTPGQIGFIHELDRAVICGDAVLNQGGRLSNPFSLTTVDRDLAKRSILRLSERNFKHLFPSHGPPIMQEGRRFVFELVQKPKKGSRK